MNLEDFKKNPYNDVRNIKIKEKTFKDCNKKFDDFNVELKKVDGCNLEEFKSNSFDRVIANLCIHHFDDPKKSI